MTGHGWSPWGDVGNTSYPIVFNLLEISESTISSEEENRLVPTHTGKTCAYLVNSRGSHMSRQGTHTTDSSKELCVSLTHTRHNQIAAKEAGGRFRKLPLGNPCRPGCMEAGWLQPRTHGRLVALRAGPGRVVGTALGRVLLAFLAGGAWDGTPGMLVQDSWGPQVEVEAEGKGREPR